MLRLQLTLLLICSALLSWGQSYFSYTAGPVICNGTAVTFRDSLSLADSIATTHTINYQWYKNETPVGGDSSTYVDALLASGDIVKCVAMVWSLVDTITFIDSVQMTVESPLTASPIVGVSSICMGTSVTLSSTDTGGVWRVTGGHLSTSLDGIISPITVGEDTVQHIVNNVCGADTAWHAIEVMTVPDSAVITGYDSVCVGSSITLSASTPGGVWTTLEADFAYVTSTGIVFGNLFGSTNIYYSLLNACGLTTSTHRVNINREVMPITGEHVICQLGYTILMNPMPGGTWQSDNFLVAPCIGSALGGLVGGLTEGVATISYTINNACGETTALFDVEVINCDTPTTVNHLPVAINTAKIYPNPSAGAYTIDITTDTDMEVPVDVLDIMGRKIATYIAKTNQHNSIELNAPAGYYTMLVYIGNEIVRLGVEKI